MADEYPSYVVTDAQGREFRGTLGHQASTDMIYGAVGYAINQWSHIDRSLFECFHTVLSSKTETISAIIYYFVTSQSQRIILINEVMKASLDESMQGSWQKLYNELTKELPLRNFLAHQPLLHRGVITNVSHLTPDNPVRVVNYIEVEVEEKELLAGRRKPKVLSQDEIVGYAQCVKNLHDKVVKFRDELRGSAKS